MGEFNMEYLFRGIIGVGKAMSFTVRKENVKLWKQLRIGPPQHGDFRPDLLQETTFFHYQMPQYQNWSDSVRVRIPSRKLDMETNTKYVPGIYQIVESSVK